MMTLLLQNWKALAAAFLAAMICAVLAWQSYRVSVLALERDAALQQAKTASATLAAWQQDTAAKINALEQEALRDAARAADLQTNLDLIGDDNENDNGPVAPVLRHAVDRLYSGGAGAADHPAAGAAQPARLPAAAGQARP